MKFLVVLIALFTSSIAFADDDAQARKALARSLEDRGVRAFEASNYCDAAHLFEASNELSPTLAMVYNAGRARESAGDLVAALSNYQSALETAEGGRKVELEERVAKLAKQIKAPFKTCGPRPAKLTKAALELELAPKVAPDKKDPVVEPVEKDEPQKDPVKGGVGPGSDLEPATGLKVPPRENKGGPVIGSPEDPEPEQPKPTGNGLFAISTAAGGAAVLLLGGGLYGVAVYEHCEGLRGNKSPDQAREAGFPFEVGGWITMGIGAALLGAGTLWVLVEE